MLSKISYVFDFIDNIGIVALVVSSILGSLKGSQFVRTRLKNKKVLKALGAIEMGVEEMMEFRNRFKNEVAGKLDDDTRELLRSKAIRIADAAVPKASEMFTKEEVDAIIKEKVKNLKAKK